MTVGGVLRTVLTVGLTMLSYVIFVGVVLECNFRADVLSMSRLSHCLFI